MPLRAHPLRGERRARPRLRMQLLDLHEERLRPLDRPAQRVPAAHEVGQHRVLRIQHGNREASLLSELWRRIFLYIPRSDPEAFDINVRCLEGVNLNKLEYDYFDGRNWEKAFHERQQARAAQ